MTNAPTPAGMAELGDAVAALASITGLAKAAMDAGVKARAALAPVAAEGGAVDVREFVEAYEFRGDFDYTPNDQEKTLIEDAIHGYLSEASLRATAGGEGL